VLETQTQLIQSIEAVHVSTYQLSAPAAACSNENKVLFFDCGAIKEKDGKARREIILCNRSSMASRACNSYNMLQLIFKSCTEKLHYFILQGNT
jgi:hypothetical protein